ncbi:hypothetical protein GDO81_017527 [Engystomops pustulosus]|uniref:Uncharacterized protein n=1 Tax=Engystomops pustulosus TaxID=76066 RepID=A0AAV7AEK6_ENGPU|nr:hypothetical protein GDO81_017527 [Engystomops pustulosus]
MNWCGSINDNPFKEKAAILNQIFFFFMISLRSVQPEPVGDFMYRHLVSRNKSGAGSFSGSSPPAAWTLQSRSSDFTFHPPDALRHVLNVTDGLYDNRYSILSTANFFLFYFFFS